MQNRAKTLLRFEDSCPKQHTVICYSTTLINSRNIETHHVHAIHGEFCCLALVLIKGGHSLTIFFKHFCITHSPWVCVHSPWVCVGEGGFFIQRPFWSVNTSMPILEGKPTEEAVDISREFLHVRLITNCWISEHQSDRT